MEAIEVDEMRTLLVAVGRIEQKVDNLGNVREIAIQTQESAKSAHNRIDDLKNETAKDLLKLEADIRADYEKKIDSLKTDNEKTTDKLDGHITWLWRLVLGCFFTSLITGIVGVFFYFLKMNGGA
jgi:uncharacterized protein YcbK (DUF882 family)